MTCSKAQSLMSAYVDGELGGRDMLEMRRHVCSCSACEAEERQVKWVKQVAAMPVPEPPEGFEARLEAVCAEAKRQKAPTSVRWIGVVAAASAMAALLSIVVVHQFGGGIQPPKPYVAAGSGQDTLTTPGAQPATASSEDALRERQYLMNSDPLSGPASTVAYAER